MKTVLILFETLSNQSRGMGHVSLKLAKTLLTDGSLEQVICLGLDRDADVFGGRAHVLMHHRVLRMIFVALSKLGRVFPALKTRRIQESVFDRFAKSRIHCRQDTLLFASRPLFNRTIERAKSNGMSVWVQSSVAHPLFNLALVKNEEMRLGLASHGAYSDEVRAEKIAQVILRADRLVTLAPEIGRFTFESFHDFIDPSRLLPLREFFSVEPEEFSAVAKARRLKGADDEIVFFHLSHLNLIKGIPYLLDAWRNLQKMGAQNCRLVLGGHMDHDIGLLIKNRYADLKNVEYPGFLPDLAKNLGEADVFISPSISDAGPATIIEAMSAGMPVISSRNCGFASLLTEKEDGFTYPYNDVSELTKILEWFADHRDQILPMGKRARSKMGDFSSTRYAEEILGHINNLDDRNRRTGQTQRNQDAHISV